MNVLRSEMSPVITTSARRKPRARLLLQARWATVVLATSSFLLLSTAAPASAEVPECPTLAERQAPVMPWSSGLQIAPAWTGPNKGKWFNLESLNFKMYPCDEFWGGIAITPVTPGWHYFRVQIMAVLDPTTPTVKTAIDTILLGIGGTQSYAIPYSSRYGSTIRGTRDGSQVVTDIYVESYDQTSDFQFTVTMQVSPRKDVANPYRTFNTGGKTAESATVGGVTNGNELRLTMTDSFTGNFPGVDGLSQFHRFILGPGGTLSLSGTLQNPAASAGATVYAHVFETTSNPVNGTTPSTTLALANGFLVGYASAGAGATVPLGYTNTFTNTSGSRKSYILRFTTSGYTPIGAVSAQLSVSGLHSPPTCIPFPRTDAWAGPFAGGEKKVYIPFNNPNEPLAFKLKDFLEIEQAVKDWNKTLAAMGKTTHFTIFTKDPPSDIALAILPIAGQSTPDGFFAVYQGLNDLSGNPVPGYGVIKLPWELTLLNSQVTASKGNYLWQTTLHEMGHFLRMDDYTACTAYDLAMYFAINANTGPFIGITDNDRTGVSPLVQ